MQERSVNLHNQLSPPLWAGRTAAPRQGGVAQGAEQILDTGWQMLARRFHLISQPARLALAPCLRMNLPSRVAATLAARGADQPKARASSPEARVLPSRAIHAPTKTEAANQHQAVQPL